MQGCFSSWCQQKGCLLAKTLPRRLIFCYSIQIFSADIGIDVTDVDSDSDIISRLDDSTLVNGSKPLKMLGIAKRDLKRPDEGLGKLKNASSLKFYSRQQKFTEP